MARIIIPFRILSGFNFVSLFLCDAKIFLPPRGDTFVAAPGTDLEIAWSFDDVIDLLFVREWYKNGVLLALVDEDEDPVIPSAKILPGVDIRKPGTLILRNVDLRHNGTYTFEISVIGASKDEISKVEVFIAVTPNATINCSTHITVHEGENIVCLCKGYGGNPPAKVTWYKDGVHTVVTGNEEIVLSLSNIDKTDSGRYTCVAQSHDLTDVKSIEVNVKFAPTVTRLSSSALLGKSVTITCESSARPEASYTIIHNDTKIVSTQQTYKIDVVKYSDAGLYQCIAENQLGKDIRNFTVIVILNAGPVQTTTVAVPSGNFSEIVKSESVVVWHVLVSLLSGVIIGIIFSYILVQYRRRCRKRESQSNPEPQTSSKVDPIYQDLDLTKMNDEENYQSLEHENELGYTELNLNRNKEEKYETLSTVL